MKTKSLPITQQTAKALKGGADTILVPIDVKQVQDKINTYRFDFNYDDFIEELKKKLGGEYISHSFKKVINEFLPLQVGDKFFCQEEFLEANICNETLVWYKSEWDIKEAILHPSKKWQPASEMTEAQSRFNREVVAIEIKRVQDINTAREMESVLGTKYINKGGSICIEDFDLLIDKFYNCLKSQNIDYDSNPYVALYKIKEI